MGHCWICCCFLALKSQASPGPAQIPCVTPSTNKCSVAAARPGLCLILWVLPPSQPISILISLGCWDFLCFASHRVTKQGLDSSTQRGRNRFSAALTQSEQFSPSLQSCSPKTAWIHVFQKLILLQYCLGFFSWPFYPIIIRISFLSSLAKFSVDL